MDWLELAVEADEEAVEAVTELLRAHGHGVAIDQPFLQPRIDEAPMPDPARRPVVKTYVPDDPQAGVIQRAIEESLWHIGQMRTVGTLQVKRIAEEDWANSWKPYFPVLRIGQRTVIVPAWRRHRKTEDEITVRLDPGMAFGTGMHPTTRLCLLAVEQTVKPGDRVLDVGTGSGILSIAAARLGAKPVVGVDTDPIAVKSARENVALNHLSRTIRILEGSADAALDAPAGAGRGASLAGSFDVVLANITARANAAIAPSHARALRPGGRLIASGILWDTVDLVEAAFTPAGLKIVDQQRDGDWVALTATRD
jgi:ribosomal protein L11 methyltransferase